MARRSRRQAKSDQSSNQQFGAPNRKIRNSMAPMNILSEDQLESIHSCSLKILEEIGVEFMGQKARDCFRAAGAEVNDETGQVRMDRELVMQVMSTAPAEFTLTPRNSLNSLHFGKNSICTTSVGGPPTVHDCVQGRRNGNFEDYCKILKLVQSFDTVHGIGNHAIIQDFFHRNRAVHSS